MKKINKKDYGQNKVLGFAECASFSQSLKPGLSRILVVEDNSIAQRATQAILSGIDCLVDGVFHGDEALRLCKTESYDLIFMDLDLDADMDGLALTQHLRTLTKAPIVALTAHAGAKIKQRCFVFGMDEVLIKPLTKIQALTIVNKYISSGSALSMDIRINRELPDSEEDLFQLEQFALLDCEQALKNFSNKSMLVELLSLMIRTEIPLDLQRMKAAFAAKDYAQVEEIAHKIKGGAVCVGTTRMKYACQYLERYWKTGQRVLFDRLYNQTINTIEDTCVHIGSWLKGYCNI